MNEHFFSERGISYRTNDWVAGRSTLVFIHGLVGSSSAWTSFESHFEPSHNILTFDLRGHGLSHKPKDLNDYAIANFVEDVFALVTHLGATDFTLVSHSFGTLISLEYFALHQKSVSSLVFLSPSFSLTKNGKTRILQPLYSAFAGFMSILPFRATIHSRTDYTRHVPSGDWNVWRTMVDLWNTSLHVYFYCMKQVYNIEREDFLDSITVPTLIIHGRKDGMFPVENSQIMANHISHSKLIVLEQADHIIVLNYGNVIIDAMDSFLKK